MTEHDTELSRVGLESIGADYPELEQCEGRVFFTVALKGKRVRVCEVSAARLRLINRQAAEAIERG